MKLTLVQPELSHAPDADNLARIRALLAAARLDLASDDILLLPERFHLSDERGAYGRDVGALARELVCHVVGGSHREIVDGESVNSGLAFDPRGRVVGRYEKLRPYGAERSFVRPGTVLGEFEIAGRRVLVLVCADFWFADLFARASALPDVVLVPALSVTRKATPDYSRALWRHLAVARAYEFGVYVGISDWAYPSELPVLFTSGVGGFADPTIVDPAHFFVPIGPHGVSVHELDFAQLEAFRRDRQERGFFWKA
jgi:omega-amidase